MTLNPLFTDPTGESMYTGSTPHRLSRPTSAGRSLATLDERVSGNPHAKNSFETVDIDPVVGYG